MRARTLFTLLRLGVVPIINENDTVVTDEIKFGDNDTLGALVTNLIEADALIILTDQPGSTRPIRASTPTPASSPRQAGDPALEAMAGGAGSSLGTRRHAHQDPGRQARGRQRRAHDHRVGPRTQCPERLAGGECIGTELRASLPMLSARKQWLADHLQLRGRVMLDDGAVKRADARRQEPAAHRRDRGRRRVRARRRRGLRRHQRQGMARGLINYSAGDTRRIMRKAPARSPRSWAIWKSRN